MLCPLCHTQNRDNAKFCKGCGRLLPEEPVGVAQAAQAGQKEQSVQTRQAEGAQGAGQTPSTPPAAQSNQPTPGASGPAEAQPKATPAPESSSPDDISLAPTQILSPQQMVAFHARRWQQELEQKQQETGHEQMDIADVPTMLFTPLAAPPAPTADAKSPDIAEMPTVIMPPHSEDAFNQSASEQPTIYAYSDTSGDTEAVPVPERTEVASEAGSANHSDAAGGSDNTPGQASAPESSTTEQTSSAEETAPSAPEAEEELEHTTQETTNQPVQTQDEGAFPVLAVGTVVGGRYEITQVLADDEQEHLYEVIDHQGYQRCWNCGSDQNAEGDEYCIDCGAALRDASYVMHEYPALESKDQESHVLQGNIVNTLVEQNHTYVIEQPQPTQVAFPNGVHLLAACDSDAGAVRRAEPNEDSTLVLLFERVHESVASPAGIFVVADGMGGHDYGQVASRTTIGVIAEKIVRELLMPPLTAEKAGDTPKELEEEDILQLVQNAVQDANTTLCQINQRDKTDMGSTLTGFMMVGDHAYIFNVGDSRTYMLRDEKLYQLTNDHSLVGQLVAGGLIEPEDVYTHPQRSQIYRSIGDKLNVQIDIFKQQVHPGDILLSCSDGLWEMVRDPQITDILTNAPNPQTACTQLIEAANTNGGEDNVSAVIVFVR
ncbi:MAG TPA: protein phosphatase 2C domain-containing protein [Ktedonobacteraceae bacterium]|nr:protein phosphatase 2C domain-containing protein [Ktedonobacteraceae bacterium]